MPLASCVQDGDAYQGFFNRVWRWYSKSLSAVSFSRTCSASVSQLFTGKMWMWRMPITTSSQEIGDSMWINGPRMKDQETEEWLPLMADSRGIIYRNTSMVLELWTGRMTCFSSVTETVVFVH